MALLTVAECQSLLRLTTSQYSTQIATLIPCIERDICLHCNNWFADTVIYREAVGGIAFARGDTSTGTTSPDTITDDQDYFTTIGFRDGTDIVVFGGSNEGIYTISSVTTDTLTLTSTGEVEDQDQDLSHHSVGPIRIARINWPRNLKPIAAQMVWSLLDKPRQGDVKSESIDDYSVTFAGEHMYPSRLVQGLSPYRRAILI
jgi:hypothetical protein